MQSQLGEDSPHKLILWLVARGSDEHLSYSLWGLWSLASFVA